MVTTGTAATPMKTEKQHEISQTLNAGPKEKRPFVYREEVNCTVTL